MSHDRAFIASLNQALRHKTVDASAHFRGLFLQAVSVFDNFVAECVGIILEHTKESKGLKFDEFPDGLKNSFISNSGKVLAYYGSGTVNGVRYDFSKLRASLARCLANDADYFFEPMVFTILMGNCTPSRLDKLFQSLGISKCIFNELGESAELKKAINESRKFQASVLARKELDRIIDTRNDIAHGSLSRALTPAELENDIVVLKGIMAAICERCQSKLGAAA